MKMGLAHAWTFRREEKSASILADAVAIRHPKELPGGIAVIELNDPPANTYTYEMMRDLDDAILEARLDKENIPKPRRR